MSQVTLIRFTIGEADELLSLQQRGFADIYEKYRDNATSPVNEPLERLTWKIETSHFYRIVAEGGTVGAIRVVYSPDGSMKRLSPLFILPEHRGKGYAQAAILAAEDIHGHSGWNLGTIAQEERNIHLYEKMGYRATGEHKSINENMTIVFFEK